MSESRGRGRLETATAVIAGTAGLLGGAWGLANGATSDGSATSRVAIGLLQGAGGAILLAFIALLAVTIATAAWSMIVALLRYLRE